MASASRPGARGDPSGMMLVWAAEAALFGLVVAGILAERPAALAATGAVIVLAFALVRFVASLRAALAAAFARHARAALAGGAVCTLLLPLVLSASPYWTFVATLALLYRAVVPGVKDPVPFSSPWRTITLDRVEDVSGDVELAGGADGRLRQAPCQPASRAARRRAGSAPSRAPVPPCPGPGPRSRGRNRAVRGEARAACG